MPLDYSPPTRRNVCGNPTCAYCGTDSVVPDTEDAAPTVEPEPEEALDADIFPDEPEEEDDEPEPEEEEEEPVYTCSSCDEEYPEDGPYYTTPGSRRICEDCFAESYTFCGRCSDRVDRDRAIEVEGDDWCEYCAESYSATCGDCEQPMRARRSFTVQRDGESLQVCGTCFNSRYRCCGNCDRIHTREEFGPNEYCNVCWPVFRARRVIREYHSGHPNGLKFFGGKGIIKYGVELELEMRPDKIYDAALAVSDSLGADHAHLERDGSLGAGRSFEVISQPHTLQAHAELWKPTFENVIGDEQYGFTVDNHVGMHVHIQTARIVKGERNRYGDLITPDKREIVITSGQLSKMIYFVNSPANEDFIEYIAGRGNVAHSVKVEKKHSSSRAPRYDENGRLVRVGATSTLGSTGHYEAVSISQHTRATAEIRIFKSVLTYAEFMKNLEFCDALVHFANATNFQRLSVDDFCHWLDTQPGQYPNLVNHLVAADWYEKPQPRTKGIAA
jgi:hypothetical protein